MQDSEFVPLDPGRSSTFIWFCLVRFTLMLSGQNPLVLGQNVNMETLSLSNPNKASELFLEGSNQAIGGESELLRMQLVQT